MPTANWKFQPLFEQHEIFKKCVKINFAKIRSLKQKLYVD